MRSNLISGCSVPAFGRWDLVLDPCSSLLHQHEQSPIAILAEHLSPRTQGVIVDPALSVGYCVGADDLLALPVAQRAHEVSRILKPHMYFGVEPGITTAHQFGTHLPIGQIAFEHFCSQPAGHLDNAGHANRNFEPLGFRPSRRNVHPAGSIQRL